MVLVDTDVLIDCLRGFAPAKEWLERTPTDVLGIPGIVAMELIIGCRDQPDLQRVQKFLGLQPNLWVTSGSGRWPSVWYKAVSRQ